MDNSILHKLQTAEDLAGIADVLLEVLPSETALVVRQCLILHWFDNDLLKALLQKMNYPPEASIEIYNEMANLPFVEARSKGLAINSSTRKGLLRRYAHSQPSLFIDAASTAASIYEMREQHGSIAAEAFYCYIVSNNTNAASQLLDKLLDEALDREDWQYITCLLYLRDEALQIPFVQFFPLTEQQWTVKGLAHRVQGEQDAAIAAYLEAIKCNPRGIPHHMMLGAIYFDQKYYQEAIQEYDTVIGIDARHVQAYINKGIVYLGWPGFNQDEVILRCFEEALQIDPGNTDAKAYRQQILERVPQRLEISSSDYTRNRYWSTFVGIVSVLLLFLGLVLIFAGILSVLLLFLGLVFIFTSSVGNLGNAFFIWLGNQIGTLATPWLLFIILVAVGFILDLVKLRRRDLEKSAKDEESNLWLASEIYMNRGISDQLDRIKSSRTRNIRKSIIELAQ